MKIRVLGSGTSTGVPVPGCRCAVCTSTDAKNDRLRTSIFIELERRDVRTAGPGEGELVADSSQVIGHVLVDTSPDLRRQALRAGIARVDAVLYTHVHADHVFGIDDLRSFNFVNKSVIDCYASAASAADLEQKFRYAFFPDDDYEGGAPPNLTLSRIEPYKPFVLFGVPVLPLPVLHGSMEVFAYRIGSFGYATDCSEIPERTREHLKDLDVLILDGLRYRPHKTHFTHEQAVREIEILKPKQAYLTHISHELEHHAANEQLKKMTKRNVEMAYDGLVLDI